MSTTPTDLELLAKITAQGFWLRQLFQIVGGQDPERLAKMIRLKTADLKNWSPDCSKGSHADDMDQAFLAMYPEIEALGFKLADDLERIAVHKRTQTRRG